MERTSKTRLSLKRPGSTSSVATDTPQRFESSERGPRRFERDDRGSSRFNRDEHSPRRFERDDRSYGSSSRFDRDDSHPSRFNRDDSRPSRFNRDDSHPSRFNRDDSRPSRFNRDDSRPSRFNRDDSHPSRFNRDDSHPGRFNRDDSRPSRFNRDDSRPGRFNRDERSSGSFERDDRGFGRASRFDRDDRRPSRFNRDERSYDRFERDDRSSGRYERDERSFSRGGYGARDEQGQSNAASPWGSAKSRPPRTERGPRPDRDNRHERGEREVIDVNKVFVSEVPIGRMVELEVCEISDKGAFVNAKEHGALFIPNSQLPEGLEVGNMMRVFLYKDADRVLATARRPYIELGMTGNLRINCVKNATAYLDLGIPKELVLPVSEQRFRMFEGDNALVYVSIDERGRLFGTQCFNRYIRDKARKDEFQVDERVKVVGVAHTPLGYRVIVNDSVYGLIYASEQKGELTIGKRYDGYITAVRNDGRLDVSLQEPGRDGIEHAAEDIMQALHFEKGHLGFNDKSDPKEIEDFLHMSKGRFKKAIGSLYKQRLIAIVDNGIDLTDEGREFCQEHFGQMRVNADIDMLDHDGADDYEGREFVDGADSSLQDDDEYEFIRRDGDERGSFDVVDGERQAFTGGNEEAAQAVFSELHDDNKFDKERD
ncbi:S1-like domain-containing RNA-binding protein [Anaerobiospirillum succiniciproducens]|uniref:S1-like domain-containing RNA-binding protein n=1 Tax=Anaerobiospirillum succiniciproducens TaxID=13335 RepID=UPI0004266C6D|nr:S1-like domain-containing RNA-binding protein [Anaerobiospirillum succiniciproducens]